MCVRVVRACVHVREVTFSYRSHTRTHWPHVLRSARMCLVALCSSTSPYITSATAGTPWFSMRRPSGVECECGVAVQCDACAAHMFTHISEHFATIRCLVLPQLPPSPSPPAVHARHMRVRVCVCARAEHSLFALRVLAACVVRLLLVWRVESSLRSLSAVICTYIIHMRTNIRARV